MEQILVVEQAQLRQHLPNQVFITQEISEILTFILENHRFAPRDSAEYDKTLKQIIPYVVIRQNDRFFLLRRLNKQTETRLHDRLSLGVGGHINPAEDLERGRSIVEVGMWRELEEEVSIERIVKLQCVGLLNDDAGDVSDYHLAVVYLLDAEGEVQVRETEKMAGTWVTLPELAEWFGQLETWSKILARSLLGLQDP